MSSAAFYANIADTSQRLITQFGKPITINHVTIGAFDPASGSSTGDTNTTTSQNVPAFVKKVTNAFRAAYPEIEVASLALIAGKDLTAEPTVGDEVIIDGLSFILAASNPLNPNTGLGLIYELVLKV